MCFTLTELNVPMVTAEVYVGCFLCDHQTRMHISLFVQSFFLKLKSRLKSAFYMNSSSWQNVVGETTHSLKLEVYFSSTKRSGAYDELEVFASLTIYNRQEVGAFSHEWHARIPELKAQ